MESNAISRRRLGITCACFAVTALILSPAGESAPESDSAMRLLQYSGFDAMLRLDAKLDGTLNDEISESMPPELRSEMVGILGKTLGYAEMRREMAATISSRLDSAVIDEQLRWWTSTAGQAVSAAQLATFRELTAQAPVPASRPTGAIVSKFAAASRGSRECLRMIVGLRRDCAKAPAASGSGGANAGAAPGPEILLSQHGRLSATDLAAYRAYLRSPGAREVMDILGDSYLQARSGKPAHVQRLIDAAVGRFARNKVGNEKDSALQTVIALVDEGRSLEESRLILHLLRYVAPRDPRIFVELARVAIKQAPARPSPHGDPTAVDPEFLEDAQGWMDRAIALQPRRADTLVLAGHLAYLKYQFPESIALLEQARGIGTTNPWLPLNLADALWALGRSKGINRDYLLRAAREFETAIAKGLPARMQPHAMHSLAYLYGDLKDFAKARVVFQRLIASSAGYDKVATLTDYAEFLFLTAGDLDGSIAAGREAARVSEFQTDHSLLARALLVKAGRLYVAGKAMDAARLVQEAQSLEPGLAQNYSNFATVPLTLPAVFALHEARVIGDLSDSAGGKTLILASAHASAADLERLIKWHADPNYMDPEEGTALHVAIQARNLAALRTLLAHGADVSARDRNGMTPLELAGQIVQKTEAKGPEILAVLQGAARRSPAAIPVGTPLRPGYIYRSLKRITSDGRWGHDLEVGTRVIFVRNCQYTDEALACLAFRHPQVKEALLDIALEKEQLVSWRDWFEEVGTAPVAAK